MLICGFVLGLVFQCLMFEMFRVIMWSLRGKLGEMSDVWFFDV